MMYKVTFAHAFESERTFGINLLWINFVSFNSSVIHGFDVLLQDAILYANFGKYWNKLNFNFNIDVTKRLNIDNFYRYQF